jgi:hypothetical protein
MKAALLILIALTLLSPGVNRVAAQTFPTLSDIDLVQTLREGGFNIYFRHAATDWSQSDKVGAKDDWLSCDSSRMRQLSADAIIGTAQMRLSTRPAAATNAVIVAHGNVAQAATPIYPGEGEAVIFRPDGNGGFQYIARIAPQDWPRIIEQVTHNE